MNATFKPLHRFFITLPNIGRGVGAMAFNAVIFLILNNSTNKTALYNYSWFLVVANFFVAFTGWGLRDYSVKEYIKNGADTVNRFSLFFSSKIPLMLLCFLVIGFIDLPPALKAWMMLLLLFRAFISLTDPLILVSKKIRQMFFAESAVYVSVIVLLFINPVFRNYVIQILVITECLRSIIALVILRSSGHLNFQLQMPFRFLFDTRFYFAIAIFSFCMSRVDVFILGIYSEDDSFAYYNIILNLLAVSQICISSVYNDSVKSVFRVNIEKANSILNKLLIQFVGLSIISVSAIFIIAKFVYGIKADYFFYGLLFINVFSYCLTIKHLYILNHSNKLGYFLIAVVISSLINSCGSLFLVPLFHMDGAVLANTVASAALALILKYLIVKNKVVTAALK